MKAKGKSAWLITWEGPESEFNGRCKVVAVLPPLLGEQNIQLLLRTLFCSEYALTLGEKLCFGTARKKEMPRYFKQLYRDINPAFSYGHFSKCYLHARQVKQLRCEESKKDCLEDTLYWTELPKFILNPDLDPNGPMPENLADLTKQVMGEREVQYTYSIRSNIEEEKRRQAGQIRTGNFSIKPRA
jgi:hypothetical protein